MAAPTRTIAAALILHAAAALHTPALRPTVMSGRRAPLLSMAAEAEGEAQEAPVQSVKVQLLAQRAGVTLSPQQEQQRRKQFTGAAASGSGAAMPTFVQRSQGPFVGLTLLATVSVAAWQTRRVYRQRQAGLLADFGVTMVDRLGDVREMEATFKSFRTDLGPGSYRGKMFVSFVVAFVKAQPISVAAVENLKKVVGVMGLSQDAVAELYADCADELKDAPSALGKLLFTAERATPEAAAAANLRGRMSNWSAETVDLLQKAMLENLYKEMCSELPADSPPPKGADTLRLSSEEAARLMKEVQDQKAQDAVKAKEEEEKRAEQQRLQQAMEAASAIATRPKPAPKAEEVEEEETRSDGTHEYECTQCGYVLFPAKGREFKFYGDDFKCPGCGADKSKFIDKGEA